LSSLGPDREVDQFEHDLFEGSACAEPDVQPQHDLAAALTAALFGSTDVATETESQEASDE